MVQLDRITFEDLTRWVAELAAGGLSPSGIRLSVYLVSAILVHAVRGRRIRSNRARGLALPRPRRRDHVFLTHGQLAALADAAGRWRLLVLVLGYTGLRWGEATALRVCDIDFTRRRIDVRRAFSDVGGKIVLGTPKSHLARTVPLPASSPNHDRAVYLGNCGALVGTRTPNLLIRSLVPDVQ